MSWYDSLPITQLQPGTQVLGTDVYPAVDTADLTESPSGTTYKYSISQLQAFLNLTVVGSNIKSANVATTTQLNATYNNGTAGVGATLTNAGSQTALFIDSEPMVVGYRVLVKDQSTQIQNGVYLVTVIGDSTHNWVLTRAPDYDSSIRSPMLGDFIGVVNGTINQLTIWFEVSPSPIVIGINAISFAELIIGGGGGGITWVYLTGVIETASVNHGYINAAAGLTTITLPASCSPGDIVRVVGANSGNWRFQANTGQIIQLGTVASSTAGTVSSTNPTDSLELVCTATNTAWGYAGGQTLGYDYT